MKKKRNIILPLLLVLSVCINIGQYAFYIYEQNVKPEAGMYMENSEQRLTSKILTLTGDDKFYWYTNEKEEAIKQGRYKLTKDDTGILYNENETVCGYVMIKDRKNIQVVWMDGNYIVLERYSDDPVIP